jgi:hypothetical protein
MMFYFDYDEHPLLDSLFLIIERILFRLMDIYMSHEERKSSYQYIKNIFFLVVTIRISQILLDNIHDLFLMDSE